MYDHLLTDGLYNILYKLFRAFPKPFNVPFFIIYQTRAIFDHCQKPGRMLFMLFFPLPWRLSNPTPLPVSELANNSSPNAFYERHDYIPVIRNMLIFKWRDSRTRALYRLYDAICLRDEMETVHEATYIWGRLNWQLEDWPDPQDPDPERYAVLAGIMEGLVESFNWRLGLGMCRDPRKASRKRREKRRGDPEPLEQCPSWPNNVPPSPRTVFLSMKHRSMEQVEASTRPYFKRRNIIGNTGSLMFV
ncbi:hypothetical protein F5880DRAFT_271541 [Lentinula raphanica]|nr:hypothetical protein F5880DRAFT_271541 [Lentinula raphanica]